MRDGAAGIGVGPGAGGKANDMLELYCGKLGDSEFGGPSQNTRCCSLAEIRRALTGWGVLLQGGKAGARVHPVFNPRTMLSGAG